MSNPLSYIWVTKSILKKRMLKLALIQLISLYDRYNRKSDQIEIEFVIERLHEEFKLTLDYTLLSNEYENLIDTFGDIKSRLTRSLDNDLARYIAYIALFYIIKDEVKKAILIKEFLLITEAFCLDSDCPFIHNLIDKA